MAKSREIRDVTIVGTGVIGASWGELYLARGLNVTAMGLSVAAVKGRVFHGRRKLRETLRQSPKVDRRDNK